MTEDATILEQEKQPGPLADIRVVELGVLLAGPFCGQLLGDFGAEVIKVEQAGTGDPMREVGPAGKGIWWNICARKAALCSHTFVHCETTDR